MNIVNQMISDYQKRRTNAKDDEALNVTNNSTRRKKSSVNVSKRVYFILGMSAVAALVALNQHTVESVYHEIVAHFQQENTEIAGLEMISREKPTIAQELKEEKVVDLEVDQQPDTESIQDVLTSPQDIASKPEEEMQQAQLQEQTLSPTKPEPIKHAEDKLVKPVQANKVESVAAAPEKIKTQKKVKSKAKKSEPKVVAVKQNRLASKPKPVAKRLTPKKAAENIQKKAIPLSGEQIAENNYQHAAQYMETGQYQKAREFLEKSLVSHPEHKQARKMLAGIYINEQQWLSAEEQLKLGMKYHQTDIEFPQWLSRVYLNTKRNKDAVNVLLAREKYANGNGGYFALLAVAQQNIKAYKKSAKAFKAALMTDNYNSKWWFGLATSLEMMEDWPSAYAAYSRAINTAQLSENLDKYARVRLDYVKSQLDVSARL